MAGPQLSPEPLAWDDDPGIEGTPAERGPLDTGTYRAGDRAGTWAYLACPADSYVDRSGAYPPGHHLRSWAYAEFVADAAQAVTVELTASGPAGLWLDGALVLRVGGGSARASVRLHEGAIPVLVRFEGVAVGETPHVAALRIEAAGVHVQIPTLIQEVGRRTAFEQLTAGTFL